MQTLSRSMILTAVATAMIAIAPAGASAQLGGLIKKKVGDRIADKVLGEQQGTERRAAAPKFSEEVLQITDARLDQLLKGVAAEEAAAASARKQEAALKQAASSQKARYEADKRAYEAKQKEFDKASDAYTKCQMAAVGRGMQSAMTANPGGMKMAEAMMKLSDSERDAFQARMEVKQKEMQAADARKDMVAAGRIRDEIDADMKKTLGVSMAEMQAGGSRSGNVMAQMEADRARCGAEPVAPVEPRDPSDVQISVRDSVRAAAVRASGLDDAQYAIMRERVSAWLASKEKKRALGYGFTDEELAVLAGKHAALKEREAALLATDHAGGWQF